MKKSKIKDISDFINFEINHQEKQEIKAHLEGDPDLEMDLGIPLWTGGGSKDQVVTVVWGGADNFLDRPTTLPYLPPGGRPKWVIFSPWWFMVRGHWQVWFYRI